MRKATLVSLFVILSLSCFAQALLRNYPKKAGTITQKSPSTFLKIAAAKKSKPGLQSLQAKKEAVEPFTIVNRYKRSDQAYTEGFSYYNGLILESTGAAGETRLQWLKLNEDTKTVEILKKFDFPGDYFGEGSALVNVNGFSSIYMMTYTQKIAVKVDTGLNSIQKVFQMPSEIQEGWGMTLLPTKPNTVLVSDGTNNIYECDVSQDLAIKQTHSFMDPSYGGILHNINELEYVDGFVYANRFMYDEIVKLDMTTNKIVQKYNTENLRSEATKMIYQMYGRYLAFDEVINGIAYNPQKGTFYLTGKRWPLIFEVKFNI